MIREVPYVAVQDSMETYVKKDFSEEPIYLPLIFVHSVYPVKGQSHQTGLFLKVYKMISVLYVELLLILNIFIL
jgi:hypothetical protein